MKESKRGCHERKREETQRRGVTERNKERKGMRVKERTVRNQRVRESREGRVREIHQVARSSSFVSRWR